MNSNTKKIWLPVGMVGSQNIENNRETPSQVQCYCQGKWTPHTDIYEIEQGLMLIVEVAGVSKDDIKVVVENRILTISGVRREPEIQQKRYVHSLELDYGMFERRFQLPLNIDPDEIEARYENGLLYLILPCLHDQTPGPINIKIV